MAMNRMREIRKKAGITQERLGGMVGISQGMISAHEKGRKNISSLSKLSEIADVLSCHVSDLIDSNIVTNPMTLLAMLRSSLSESIHDPKRLKRILTHIEMIEEEISE